LLGFAGAFRRSELVALDVADLEETDDGFRITIRKSKTDQEGLGQTIAIVRSGSATCPVKSVKAWLQKSGITDGPLFRPVAKGGRLGLQRLNDKSVYDLVMAYADGIDLKAADFGAHSLRSGFLTSASRRRVLPVAACAGLAVARILVGLKDGIAARPSVGTHQVVIRVVGMIGLRCESPYGEQGASDNGAFHGVVLGPDGLGPNFLGTTPKRSSHRLRRRFIKGGRFGS